MLLRVVRMVVDLLIYGRMINFSQSKEYVDFIDALVTRAYTGAHASSPHHRSGVGMRVEDWSSFCHSTRKISWPSEQFIMVFSSEESFISSL